jgi:hypothetical protein
MARYNSALASTTITGTHTISSPNQGAFTNLAGTAPYTVTLPNPSLFPGSNQTFYNATSGTITLSTATGILTGTGGSNASTVLCFAGNVLSVTSDGTNYVVISEDGSALTATTGSFSGNVTMNGGGATVLLTPQTVTINPSSQSSIDRVDIGVTNRGSGAFTSLTANAATTFTANTASTTTGTGTLVVTGGVGVSGQVTATTVSATNIYGTVQTAAQANITSTGSLTTPGLTVNNILSTFDGNNYNTASQTGITIIDHGNNTALGDLQSYLQFRGRYWSGDNNTAMYARIGLIKDQSNGNTGTALGFYTQPLAGAETLRMYLSGAGNLYIGTTTGSNNSARLTVNVVPGIPDVSGATLTTGALRVATTTGNSQVLDQGIYNDGTYGAWIQARNGGDFSSNSPLILNPNGGNVGIGTRDFTAGYTFNVAKRARFNGMMLGNGDGSNAADNRIGLDWASGSYAQIVAQQNVPLYLGVGGATKVALDSGGHWLPLTNDSQNLGSATQAWGNIFTNDLHLCNETKVNGNDVDGTTGNWTIQEGAENLYIINNKTGKKYAFALREIE